MAEGYIQVVPSVNNSYTLNAFMERSADIDSTDKSTIKKYGNVVEINISSKFLLTLQGGKDTIFTVASDIYPAVRTNFVVLISHNGVLRTVRGYIDTNGYVNIVHSGVSENDLIYANVVYII